MAYSLTLDQIESVTDLECAWGTTRLLPPMAEIPADFTEQRKDNPYVELVNALFNRRPLPEMEFHLIDGLSRQKLNRCVQAHLASREPKHEHKVAGVAYLISLAGTLGPVTETEPPASTD